jgi:ubiquitin-activating enzyme E1
MQQYQILLVGMGGLGIEIAKNLVLTGVKALTICDDDLVKISDLSSNFFLREDMIGRPRASSCYSPLKELNERVHLSVHTGPITEAEVRGFNIVVLTNNSSRSRLIELNRICRQNQIGFILADTRGLFGTVFVDLGSSFQTNDENGNRPIDRYAFFLFVWISHFLKTFDYVVLLSQLRTNLLLL